MLTLFAKALALDGHATYIAVCQKSRLLLGVSKEVATEIIFTPGMVEHQYSIN